MDRERLDNLCEKGILGLVLAVLVFGPLSAGAVRPMEFLVLQCLTLGVLAIWSVRLWIRPSHRLLWPPICWAVVGFLGYAIIRYSEAEIEYVARAELIRIVIYAILFFAILDNLNRQESTQLISFVLIFLGMAISLYAVYEFITNSPVVWHFLSPERKPEQYMKRGTGTYICPNNLAGFLEMILPLALGYTLVGRFKHTVKVFVGYAAVAILAGIGVSLSRGGWLATGLALTVFFGVLFVSRASRLPAIVFVLLLVTAGVFFFKGYQPQHRWRQMFHESGVVDDVRFYLWKPAVQIWRENLWWGGGPAHYDHRFPAHRPNVVQMRAGYAHNDYLNVLADWGIVGAVMILAAFVLLFAGVLKSWKFVHRSNDLGSKPSNRSSFVLGSAVGLGALLLHSVVDFNMQIPANAILAVTLMAMLTGHLRFATERHWVPLGWSIRIGLTALCVIGSAYLGQQGWKRFREQVLLDRVERIGSIIKEKTEILRLRAETFDKVPSGEEIDLEPTIRLAKEIDEAVHRQLEALKLAHGVEPMNGETTYKIGEAYRRMSWSGGEGYGELARESMIWLAAGMKVNPLDAYNYLRYGMCLDWLGRHSSADRYFRRALELDPKSYYMAAHYGWHFISSGDHRSAKEWFEKSLKLSDWRPNDMAHGYLRIIAKILAERGDN